MTLPNILSALKHLILDEQLLPANSDERKTKYRSLFPLLTVDELDDLAKIEPHRIEIYATSIFAQEAGLLGRSFPLTFRVLKEVWPRVRNTAYSAVAFARELHALVPWNSQETQLLGANLVKFLDTEGKPFREAAAILPDLARYELLCLEIRKSPDGRLGPRDCLDLSGATDRTVSELMQLPMYVPPAVRSLTASFDVIEYVRRAKASEEALPDPGEKSLHVIIGGRDREGRSYCTEVDRAIAEFLCEVRASGEAVALEDLAERYLGIQPEEVSEIEAFRGFMVLVSELSRGGIVVLSEASRVEG